MDFKYNGHLVLEERLQLVAEEIIDKYPNISTKEAILIASLEDKITTKKTLVMEFYRLYNILSVMHNNITIFEKVIHDLISIYKQFIISDELDEKIDNIMQEVLNYKLGKRKYFPIISEFY